MMGRASLEREILEPDKYAELIDVYINLLDDLENKYGIIENSEIEELVNFQLNKNIPKHNWFEYKHGYSEKLIQQLILDTKPSKGSFIFDPFSGVGTTNLVAQEMGYNTIGFDINPVATLVSKVKTFIWQTDELEKIAQYIHNFSPPYMTKSIPHTKLLENSFRTSDFNKLMNIRGFYESIPEQSIQDFFRVAYLSIIEAVSNRVKDGNGLKYAQNKQRIGDVYQFYLNKCNSMLEDSRASISNPRKPALIKWGSITDKDSIDELRKNNVELVIFSPPYANCFDYFEVYKLEMWLGGFVKTYKDFNVFREKAIRSHVNSKFSHSYTNDNIDVNLIAELISCFNIWNKNIPYMLRGYFDDMTEILKIIYENLAPGGKCFIVVANSGYRGILVPTDLLLSDIANRIGFRVKKLSLARKIRASSQQMKILHETYTKLMRESLIELEK